MPDQKNDFSFIPEEQTYTSLQDKNEENFSFYLKVICGFVVLLSVYLWSSNQFVSKENRVPAYQAQDASQFSYKQISIDDLVVLLKNENKLQPTKVELALQTKSSKVIEEIKDSHDRIKDHLVFILSHKDISTFSEPVKLSSLQTDIVTQLNLFLTSGKIENVQLQNTSIK